MSVNRLALRCGAALVMVVLVAVAAVQARLPSDAEWEQRTEASLTVPRPTFFAHPAPRFLVLDADAGGFKTVDYSGFVSGYRLARRDVLSEAEVLRIVRKHAGDPMGSVASDLSDRSRGLHLAAGLAGFVVEPDYGHITLIVVGGLAGLGVLAFMVRRVFRGRARRA